MANFHQVPVNPKHRAPIRLFAAGTPTPALPATLTAGQTLSVPVTFSPTASGADTGSLSVTTDAGDYAFGLSGTGTQPGLSAPEFHRSGGPMV